MTSNSDTAKAIAKLMRAKGSPSQNSLASTTGSSQAYLSQVLNGDRVPSAEWLNTVALGLGLSERERGELHRAAAKDHGFEIDLCEGKKSAPRRARK